MSSPDLSPIVTSATLHTAIVVHSLREATRRYATLFGIGSWEVYTLEPPGITRLEVDGQPLATRAMIANARTPGMQWQLVEPLDDRSTYAEFLRRRGEGVHHIACAVDDFEAALAQAHKHGIKLIQRANWYGLDYAYLGAEPLVGVNIELVYTPPGFVAPPPEAIWPA